MTTERKLPAEQETLPKITPIVAEIIAILDSSPTAFIFFVSSATNDESRIIIGDTALSTYKDKQAKLIQLETKISRLEVAVATACSTGSITNRNCYSLPTHQISNIAHRILEKVPNQAFGQLHIPYANAQVFVSHGTTSNVLLTFRIKNQVLSR